MRAHSNVYLAAMLGLICFLCIDCSKHPLTAKVSHDDSLMSAACTMRNATATKEHIGGSFGPDVRYGIDPDPQP